MKNVFALTDSVSILGSNPPFSARHLRVLELALRTAWQDLHKNSTISGALSSANEADISLLLRNALNDLREKENGGIVGYDCDTFERPQVGAEVLTPTGEIRKPDIVFALSGRPRRGVSDGMKDGIFVECKILEQGTNKNVSAYCNDGVHRFVEGSYSAWMREGMMVGYVRSGYSLPDDLSKLLKTNEMKKHLASDGKLAQCDLTNILPRVYISIHKRAWSYLDGKHPGPVQIRHLWLQV